MKNFLIALIGLAVLMSFTACGVFGNSAPKEDTVYRIPNSDICVPLPEKAEAMSDGTVKIGQAVLNFKAAQKSELYEEETPADYLKRRAFDMLSPEHSSTLYLEATVSQVKGYYSTYYFINDTMDVQALDHKCVCIYLNIFDGTDTMIITEISGGHENIKRNQNTIDIIISRMAYHSETSET